MPPTAVAGAVPSRWLAILAICLRSDVFLEILCLNYADQVTETLLMQLLAIPNRAARLQHVKAAGMLPGEGVQEGRIQTVQIQRRILERVRPVHLHQEAEGASGHVEIRNQHFLSGLTANFKGKVRSDYRLRLFPPGSRNANHMRPWRTSLVLSIFGNLFVAHDRVSEGAHNADGVELPLALPGMPPPGDTGEVPGYENQLAQIVAELNRAVPGARDTRRDAFNDTDLASLDAVLTHAVHLGASDLLLIADVPVTLRVGGVLSHSTGPPLSPEGTRNLLLPLMTPAQSQELNRNKSADLCFSREGIGRFRANVHFQRGTIAGSIRLLPEKIPTLESLHLPAGLRVLAEARQGLVLVTGPTGCGKSSTLAALVDLINGTRHDHVVTIEDPIEYVHSNRKAIIEQIEVGQDAADFAGSLRGILRQDPDVILVGEMRDAETMAMVLTAAETGHLVLSTLHTNDAAQAVSRILDSFPLSNQPQIRQQLSLALLAVVAQQLIPTTGKGERYPVVEILKATSGVRSLIRKGEDHQLYSAISTGRSEGMMSMEQSLAEMVRSGRIHRETAMAHCFRPDDLTRYLQG